MKVAVVTPTIGTPCLEQCVESVASQSYDNLVHCVFIDGQEHVDSVRQQIGKSSKIKTITLDENIGKDWYGHRVYAACSFLVNADAIVYLDEDNWIDPDHVASLAEEIKQGAEWAYSLRKICTNTGEFICNDDCESLGKWSAYFDKRVFHIDTSCYMIPRDIAVRVGHSWYAQWGADRNFFATLSKYFPNYSCSGKYTMNYRLDGNPTSVSGSFFQKGNAMQKHKYSVFPWQK